MQASNAFAGSILRPVMGGWMDSRIPEIAKRLHEMSGGKLTLVVRCDQRSGRAQCYDLFESVQGADHWVTRWSLDQADQIIVDVLRSDRLAPGHVPVANSMRASHDRKRQAAIDEATDLTLEFADRVEGVKRDMEGRKDFHGQTGLGPSPRDRSQNHRGTEGRK